MNRRVIYTIFGIVLAFAIAAGGWVLTGRLIETRSYALMSEAGTALANAPPALMPPVLPSSADEADSPEGEAAGEHGAVHMLSVQEIVSIIQSREMRSRDRPHEPTVDQISMGQAIDIGRGRLQSLYRRGLIELEMLDATQTNAFLSQRIPPDQDEFLDPMYSFWTVTFSGNNMRSTLLINALTGQVWSYEILLQTVSNLNVMPVDEAADILYEFLSDIGIPGCEESARAVVMRDRSAVAVLMSFADGEAFAMFSIEGRFYQNELWMFRSFSVELTTQEPMAGIE